MKTDVGAALMFSRVQRLAAVLVVCWSGTAAAAGDVVSNFNSAGEHAFAPAYGEALPPVGYVEFCAREANECERLGGSSPEVRLTDERWQALRDVNDFVNDKIRPAHDMELHGVPERWSIPTEAGDCEDYVLLKKRYLEGLGFPAETLLITVVLEEQGGGHAVLMVRTSAGDFVLDNRRADIKRWSDTGYFFLKRQSQHDPLQWIALTPRKTPDPAAIAGGN
ncbi:MAG: transglutaminase-like cysteine peptidase [Hyphomicrobiales bacterium]